MSDTPLESVSGWTPDHVARMKSAWITTAEQVVALAATPGGKNSLAEQLAVSPEQCETLLASARSKLSPAVLAEMSRAVDPRKLGLGALDPAGKRN